MLDDLAMQIARTLVSEMQAVDRDGNIDHKSRLTALKEARAFLQTLLPKLTKEDRETFARSLSSEMSSKLDYIKLQEEKLAKIGSQPKPGDGDKPAETVATVADPAAKPD